MESAAAALLIILWIAIIIVWCFFIIGFYLAMFGLLIGMVVIWILMLMDCLQRDFAKPEDRTLWILIVVLTGWLGSIIYYFMIKRPADKLQLAGR